MPQLVQLQGEYGSKGLQVMGLTPADAEDAGAFIAKHELTYPVLAGAGEEKSAFGVKWFPAVFLVDPAGKVVTQELGDVEDIVSAKL